MSRSHVQGIVSTCWRRLRSTLVQLTGWLKRPADTQPPDRTAPAEPAGGRGDSRTRFWAEFRAGQREAEARIARRLP